MPTDYQWLISVLFILLHRFINRPRKISVTRFDVADVDGTSAVSFLEVIRAKCWRVESHQDCTTHCTAQHMTIRGVKWS